MKKIETLNNQNQQNMSSIQQYTVSVTTDTLTVVGSIVNLMAKVKPSGIYDVNFKDGNTILNSSPIKTDTDGKISYPWSTIGQQLGIHSIFVELINHQYTSSPLTIALVSNQNQCTTIAINNPSPINAYIGDMIPLSVTATVTEKSVVEFRDIKTNMIIGSCIVTPTEKSCIANIDTTEAPAGEYSIKAKIGSFCESDPPKIVKLQEKPGKLVILTIPPGAEIYINDVNSGKKSSTIIDIPPKINHSIKLKLSGYKEYIYPGNPINIEPGDIKFIETIMVPLSPPSGTGTLNVTSTPDKINFDIYSDFKGKTPMTIYNVPAGINAYRAGIESEFAFAIGITTGSFEIKSGQTTNLHINVPILGAVGIESIPMGAEIYIDGINIGARTSYTALLLSGLHTYELRLPGYKDKSGIFTVAADPNVPVIISETLQPESGAAAALLVGGAAVGMMLLSK